MGFLFFLFPFFFFFFKHSKSTNQKPWAGFCLQEEKSSQTQNQMLPHLYIHSSYPILFTQSEAFHLLNFSLSLICFCHPTVFIGLIFQLNLQKVTFFVGIVRDRIFVLELSDMNSEFCVSIFKYRII